MSETTITRESPLAADVIPLMERHRQAMHADTPPESIHMMSASELDHPDIAFYAMRDGARAVGMGAFKRIDATHAEIKSMHVLAEERGRGLARLMLAHLVAEAQAAGFRQLSLETGSQDSFIAARMLYRNAGFREVGPFADYTDDPNSIYMTIDL